MARFSTLTSAGIAATLMFSVNAVHAAVKQTVTFESKGQIITGHLYLPEDASQTNPVPGVIVSGSWTSVKEQMSGTYAQALADQGYAALAFDFRGWGESADEAPVTLKYVEHPQEKTQDIISAASFLVSHPAVENTGLATLGICASAGYAIDAANQSDLIQTAAVVAPWLHDADIINQVYGENVPGLLDATLQATAAFQPVWLEAASNTNTSSVMYQADYYTDPNRGAIPEYDNKFSVLSWQPWLEYDAIQTAAALNIDVLLVHSPAAAIPQGADKFVRQAGQQASIVWLDNITQFEFYDNPKAIELALTHVTAHFSRAL